MALQEAIRSAERIAADKGEHLGDLRSSLQLDDGRWLLEFDVTDDPPEWSWWVLVTESGEVQIMNVFPSWTNRAFFDPPPATNT